MKTVPFSRVKRRDRAVEDESWIKDMLRRAAIGVLATSRNGQPYIVMRHFVFDEEASAVYMHGALHGRTREDIESNDRVCFSAGEIGRQLPGATASDMSSEYGSVVIFGRARIVDDEAEAMHAMRSLVEKYFSRLSYGKDYSPIMPKELAGLCVYRVSIEEWSGKRKTAPADFPGAFDYVEGERRG